MNNFTITLTPPDIKQAYYVSYFKFPANVYLDLIANEPKINLDIHNPLFIM